MMVGPQIAGATAWRQAVDAYTEATRGYERARLRRDRAIVRAHRQGHSVPRIAEAFTLDRQRIYQIVRRP